MRSVTTINPAVSSCVAGYVLKPNPAIAFLDAGALLDTYWMVVEFPANWFLAERSDDGRDLSVRYFTQPEIPPEGVPSR
jgi:hypothetical protein